MDNGLTGLIGLARKAGKIEIGEEPAAIAARTHKAKLILLAADAADNTLRRAEGLGNEGNCPVLNSSLTKAELGWALGRSSCAMAALTDVGLAAAITKKLAVQDPDLYGETAGRLTHKAEKTYRRRKEKQARAAAQAKGKPWAAPSKEHQE